MATSTETIHGVTFNYPTDTGETYSIKFKNESGESKTATFTKVDEFELFDTRLYRTLNLYDLNYTKEGIAGKGYSNTFYPHYDYGSYVTDFYSTPGSIATKMEEIKFDETNKDSKEIKEKLEEQMAGVKEFNTKHYKEYLSPRSFIHPYALVKLAGAHGSPDIVAKALTYDRYDKRKFYEIDGGDSFSGNYSKTPTTTALIRWGSESDRGKTPYSFQDFVFCKWWNKIENNRLITLRRYSAPVTDNIEFADYETSESTDLVGSESIKAKSTDKNNSGESTMYGRNNDRPYVPLATAVTYFGDDTDNKLSSILAFSAKYNWEEVKAQKNPMDLSAEQNDAGANLINDGEGKSSILAAISGGLGKTTRMLGILGEISGNKTINLEGAPGTAPPDPYNSGPYENRILGPVNVITNSWRRSRGLEFTGDGLKITFEYVARPIGGINSKAVLLDLLANMLVLTYSSGTWFGGMWRYRTSKPAVYPFKYGDVMNALYRGKLTGEEGAINKLTKNIFADIGNSLSTVLPDMASALGNFLSGVANAFSNLVHGKGLTDGEVKEKFSNFANTNTFKTIEKVVAAKALKGTTVPFINGQRALLTGEPVGDWHLTIGNPLNPIAMIGNLIVKDLNVTFSDELGPDDFPIGFKAVVTLAHGLGRDRDAIESMFNRGFGRIYTLPASFRSSADGETKVDEYTGGVNTVSGRTKYEEIRNTYYGGGTAFIAKIQQSKLKNAGSIYDGKVRDIESLKPTSEYKYTPVGNIPDYYVSPWMMGMIM